MSRSRMLGLLVLPFLPILGQVKTDAGVYREPPRADPPAPGDIYKDPVFGASILRLSGSNDGSDCQVQYSYWPSFNSNNTRVHAVCVIGGTEELRVWRLDPIAFARGPSMVLAIPTPSGWPVSSSDAIWSGIDPDVI